MHAKKLMATVVIAAALNASGSFAQTADVSSDVSADVQIVVEAPGIANLPSVKAMIEDLRSEGFVYIEIRRTFLGRARILAYSATEKREIILNPTTSEVLRDLAQENTGEFPANAKGLAASSTAYENNKGGNGVGNNNGTGNNNGNAGGGPRN